MKHNQVQNTTKGQPNIETLSQITQDIGNYLLLNPSDLREYDISSI